MFIRIKNIKSSNGTVRPYAYVCSSYWDKEKQQARQKVVKYMGLVRNLRLISEGICPICRQQQENPEKAKTHCIKLFKVMKNEASNIQCLCYSCNQKKRNIPMPKFQERYMENVSLQ